MIECETVKAFILAADGSCELIIPAYTRTREDFATVLQAHLNDYDNGSEIAGSQLSVGDFALYLLRKASEEPRTMD